MYIVGLRIEQFVDVADYDSGDELFQNEKYILYGKRHDKLWEITLTTSHGMCGSGWTTASWGHAEIKEVKKIGRITHVPKDTIFIENLYEEIMQTNECSNKYFYADGDGGDSYYPCGSAGVNLEFFHQSIRHKAKRPVWIFHGNSNLGKSYLAELIQGKEIYETDSSPTLPEQITADIVVVGNKYAFSDEDITSRLFGEVEIISVKFSSLLELENTKVKSQKRSGHVIWFNADTRLGTIEDHLTGESYSINSSTIYTVDKNLDSNDEVYFVVDPTGLAGNITLKM